METKTENRRKTTSTPPTGVEGNAAPTEPVTALTTTGVAPGENAGVAANDQLDDISRFMIENGNQGDKDFTASDVAIPFFSILQKMSPQVDETSGSFIEGAKAGMFYNNVTGEVYDTAAVPGKPAPPGILVIPAKHRGVFVEWVPRNSGGGFKGEHPQDTPLQNEASLDEETRKLILKNGNHLVETKYFYVILVTPEGPRWGVIGLSASGLKHARRWSTTIKDSTTRIGDKVIAVPITAQLYRIRAKVEENEKGSWFGIDVKPEGTLLDMKDRAAANLLLAAANGLREAVDQGRTKVTPVVDGDGEKQEIPF